MGNQLELKTAEEGRRLEAPEEGIRFPERWIVLAKRKIFILKFVGIIMALTVPAVFLWPKTYTAKAQIMPPQQNQSLAAMAALSQLGSLASLAGKDLGVRTTGDIYIALLRSRTVADALIDRFLLMKVYGEKLRVETRLKLEKRTDVTLGKGGVILIAVDDRDPQRATDLANAYVEELQKLTKTLAVGEASQRRVFFENQMKAASDQLGIAEVAFKQTQEKTGLISLDGQSRAMIEALVSLRARVSAQEVQVQAMHSFATGQNPDLIRSEQELAALRDQLAKLEGGHDARSFGDVPIEQVPSAALEYIRKLRDVKYQEALFELLAKQYEAARIDESREAMLVQVLDRAVRPERHSWPKRGIFVLLGFFLALLLAVTIASTAEAIEQANQDPQFAARFQLFRYYVRGKSKS
jgi:tyrosine-protein kinase Etk/Wzc